MSEKKFFPEGLFYKTPRVGAPEFVMGQVSINVSDFKKYLERVKGEWLNLDLKVSKEGKGYAEVNTWKPEKIYVDDEERDDLPF
jgi:hypothetical protein